MYREEETAADRLDISGERREVRRSGLARFARYFFFRLLALFLAVVVAIYLLVLISNLGGYLDEIVEAQIWESIGYHMLEHRDRMIDWTAEERMEYQQHMAEAMMRGRGLHQPFLLRSFYYLRDAVTLDLGRARSMRTLRGDNHVRAIIRERLPPTLQLMLSYLVLSLLMTLVISLYLTRSHGSLFDRFVILLAPSSAAPPWFYGMFFIIIFAATLGWLPYGGIMDHPVPENRFFYFISYLRHLLLPVLSLFVSSFFIRIYNLRTFFMIYAREEYVDFARAKGLPEKTIEVKHILRPTLPPVITNFALELITLWMGSIILEQIFDWPGLGQMLFHAAHRFDTALLIGSQVIYAYMLAVTVFLLDLSYAILDPRIKMNNNSKNNY